VAGWGLLVPAVLLTGWDVILGGASRGSGGFEAAFLVITGLVVIPGIVVANCWLYFVRWPGRGTLLLAGLVLPGLMALAQTLLFFGPRRLLDPVNRALTQSPWLLWMFVGLFFVPLAVMILRAAVRQPDAP
jgi:hypothetical protein